MRIFKILFSTIFLAGMLLTHDYTAAQEAPPSNLYGTVVADSTMQPLADVEVRVQGLDQAAVTDELGRFMFEDLQPGTYTIVVRVPGYKPWSREVKVTNEGRELQIELLREEEEIP